jgi:hypothetical protein
VIDTSRVWCRLACEMAGFAAGLLMIPVAAPSAVLPAAVAQTPAASPFDSDNLPDDEPMTLLIRSDQVVTGTSTATTVIRGHWNPRTGWVPE